MRERENFPAKNSNLRHCRARSQNKGLSEYQRRASCLRTLPEAERQAGNSQSWKVRAKLGLRDSIPYETSSRLPVANHVFLGSWTVYIQQEGHSQRSAPQRRHVAHLRRQSCYAPRNMSGWDRGGDKTQCTWGECASQAPGRLNCSDLGRA